MTYEPNPRDLSEIQLPARLQDVVELIAADVHETWAQQRKLEGWRFGTVLDAGEKTHPRMVPYDQLPESERDVDRATVLKTIRMLLWLGYQIEKRGECP